MFSMPVRAQTIAEIPGKMPEISRMRFLNVFKYILKETITFFARNYLFTHEITFFCVKMDDNKKNTTLDFQGIYIQYFLKYI